MAHHANAEYSKAHHTNYTMVSFLIDQNARFLLTVYIAASTTRFKLLSGTLKARVHTGRSSIN